MSSSRQIDLQFLSFRPQCYSALSSIESNQISSLFLKWYSCDHCFGTQLCLFVRSAGRKGDTKINDGSCFICESSEDISVAKLACRDLKFIRT